jgi:hypothetical protein
MCAPIQAECLTNPAFSVYIFFFKCNIQDFLGSRIHLRSIIYTSRGGGRQPNREATKRKCCGSFIPNEDIFPQFGENCQINNPYCFLLILGSASLYVPVLSCSADGPAVAVIPNVVVFCACCHFF